MATHEGLYKALSYEILQFYTRTIYLLDFQAVIDKPVYNELYPNSDPRNILEFLVDKIKIYFGDPYITLWQTHALDLFDSNVSKFSNIDLQKTINSIEEIPDNTSMRLSIYSSHIPSKCSLYAKITKIVLSREKMM